MAFEEFAGILEAHENEIAQQVAKEVIERKLSPSKASFEEFVQLMLVPLRMMTRYLKTGDISEIKNNSQQYIASRFDNGVTVESMQAVNEVFFRKLKELIEKELPGSENERQRTMYNRRLDSIKTLSNVTSVNTRMQKK